MNNIALSIEKTDDSSSKISSLNSVTKMVTLNEKKLSNLGPFELDKRNFFSYTVLPALNKARTVKEKWIILIAKARGNNLFICDKIYN